MKRLSVALVALVIAACGASGERPAAPAPSADDAFVVRLYNQQQTTVSLLRDARSALRERAAKRLVAPMLKLRGQTLAQLEPFRSKAGSPDTLADLGVSRAKAAEDVTADALKGARPLDPAFLTTMARLDDGTVALGRAELAHGRDPAVKAVARRLIVDHMRELTRINGAIAALQQTA